MEKISWFDEYIDPECVPLIIALNQLPGIETFESCCGHLKYPYCIWFKCNNFTSLAIITRTFDKRYSDGKWRITLDTSDVEWPPYKTFSVCLESKQAFKSWDEMFKSVNNAVGSLYYWSSPRFKDHFNGIEDKKAEIEREEKREDCNRLLDTLSKYLNSDTADNEIEKNYIVNKIKYLYGYRTYDVIEAVEQEPMLESEEN